MLAERETSRIPKISKREFANTSRGKKTLARNAERTSEKGFFKLSDGVRIYYEDSGLDIDKTPVVFLYGLICSQSHWKHQLRYLRNTRRCIWMDYRGHHNSDMPKDLSTVNRVQFTKDLKELLEYRKVKKAILIGHSLGTQVALEFAKNYPDKIEALILAHGTSGNPCETVFRSNISEVFFDHLKGISDKFPQISERLWKAGGENRFMRPLTLKVIHYTGFHPTLINPEEVKEYVSVAGTFTMKLFSDLLNEMRQFNGMHWIHKLTQPTLIIAGEMDLITPAVNQEIMHQLMPNSKLLKVPSGSHCAQMDRPGFVNRAIKDFLQTL